MTDQTPKTPSRIGLSIALDGQTVAQYELDRPEDSASTATLIAELASHVGGEAVHKLCGPDIAKQWGDYLFAWPPPQEDKAEPFLRVLLDLLEGQDSTGWSWHLRRLDDSVHLVHRDGREHIAQAAKAFIDTIRAHRYADTEAHRVLGAMFAGFGIPWAGLDPSAAPGVPREVAEVEQAVLRAAQPLLASAADRLAELGRHIQDTPPLQEDPAPERVKALATELDLHPVRARRLAAVLREAPDVAALLAQALEAEADEARGDQDTIRLTPPRPTLEAIQHLWRRNTDVDSAFVQRQYEGAHAKWQALYGPTDPGQSNDLTRRAMEAMAFDWAAHGDDPDEAFQQQVGCDSAEEAFRRAIRPWNAQGRVKVGNVMFGDLGKSLFKDLPPRRRSATPADLYRLLYLTAPTGLDFRDMYGGGLFGITSPCGRFAMRFYLHKYELAAYQYVDKDLAVRTREERGPVVIECGIPGVDNGVATRHPDALRWFQMVFEALHRQWDVYPGNNFEV